MNSSKSRLIFKPQGWFGASLDWLMRPVMYWLQDTWYEEPQRTHFWNNHKFDPKTFDFRNDFMVLVPGDPFAAKRRLWGVIPLFHMPRFGGWCEYVVLDAGDFTGEWYVGWTTVDVTGVSQVPLRGLVRTLHGSKKTCFFGVTVHGKQIPLKIFGFGRIGKGGPFSGLPLR